jgi:hypothetical protein
MFCTKCGKENKDDVNFCAYCGMAVEKEQAPASSRRVATKCSICGKELSPSEVRFASSTSFKPCCSGCVGNTARRTDTPKRNLEAEMRTWTQAKINNQLEREVRLHEATQAATEAAQAGPPYDLQRIYSTARQALLASREVRDGYTGEATATQPMPDFTTESGAAEATNEIQEFNLFHTNQQELLGRILAEKTEGQARPAQEKPPKAIVDFILQSRVFRDSITGEMTRFTRPNPELMTEAEMIQETNELKPIVEKETEKQKRLKGNQP